MRADTFEGTGGLSIFFRSWSAIGPTRGVVVIVPGFNSHSGYYTWAAEQFAAGGLAVYAIDLRGRGKSDGERFYVNTFADYVSDVAGLVALVKSHNPGQPVYLLGHSAGGVVSCLYAFGNPAQLAGLICESFAYHLPAPDFALAVLKVLSYLAPHMRVLRLKNADFSRDPAVIRAMNTDALIAGEKQPLRTVAELARANDRLEKAFARITLPLLILHGTADKAALASGSRFFHKTAGSRDKTLKLYDGHVHDLLNDTDKELVLSDIEEWITARLAAADKRTQAPIPDGARVLIGDLA